MSSITDIGLNIAPEFRRQYAPLLPLCVAGLERTFNQETQLFDRQIRGGVMARTLGTEDLTSTCICLIGIDRALIKLSSVIDAPTVLSHVRRLAAKRRYIGAAGLIVWAHAVHDDADLETVFRAAGITPWRFQEQISQLTTMEVAWLVSGLTHEWLRRAGAPDIEELTLRAYDELTLRFAETTALMHHCGASAHLAHAVRRRVTNFADQIYALQAFSFVAVAGLTPQARRFATMLGESLVSLQGDRGEWWWHYTSSGGRPLERYPVYSVHQYGMAPMALFALAAAGGPEFVEPVRRSLAWLEDNEAGFAMVDPAASTIWRDVERAEGRLVRTLRSTFEMAGLCGTRVPRDKLRINRETRPYEWAWCLYANAIAERLENGRHLL